MKQTTINATSCDALTALNSPFGSTGSMYLALFHKGFSALECVCWPDFIVPACLSPPSHVKIQVLENYSARQLLSR